MKVSCNRFVINIFTKLVKVEEFIFINYSLKGYEYVLFIIIIKCLARLKLKICSKITKQKITLIYL